MIRHPLIDQRFRARISGFWEHKCTILTPQYTTTASNQKVLSGGYDVVIGMTNIPCRMAPFIETRMTDDERRTDMIEAKIVRRTAKLNAYLPQIDTRRMVAYIDGKVYQIRGVESDSSSFSTRLRLEILTP